MGRTISLGTLVTRCKQRCDLENAGNPGDPEWKSYISQVYAELFSIIAETGMRHFETESNIVTTGGASYALPSDHLSTIGVDYLVNASTDERRRLVETMIQERNLMRGAPGSSEARSYSIVGTNVVLGPTPPAGQTYKLIYVSQPADLSAAADGTLLEMATPEGEQFLIWGVSVLVLHKLQRDMTGAISERERCRESVYNWAVLRALVNPRRRIVENDPFYESEMDAADYWGRG